MRATAALLFALTAAVVHAGDPPAPAADSIADAKKGLAEIRAPQGQLDTPVAVPLMDMKDLGPGPGGPRIEMPTLESQEKDASLDPMKKKVGTGNWLVDAMEKKSDGSAASRAKEKDEILKGDPELLRPDEKLALQAERDALQAGGSGEKQAPKEAPAAVYNPLDSFMSSWVSAKDHDLLVPTSKGDGPVAVEGGRSHADFLPGLDPGQSSSFTENLFAPSEAGAVADARSEANPYLGGLDGPAPAAAKAFALPEVPGFGPASLLDLGRGMSTSGVDPRPLDTSRSFIPDFAQVPDDDKYFKQLKRF
jgi:hypothetical protein